MKILLPVDGSSHSDRATQHIIALLDRAGIDLAHDVLLHLTALPVTLVK